ncbi:hypothetical protein MHU86_20968 [Fragilaria crotonensis]|nr:hypothetical protein MHU86_20968 [Fragilaria crotonensis]
MKSTALQSISDDNVARSQSSSTASVSSLSDTVKATNRTTKSSFQASDEPLPSALSDINHGAFHAVWNGITDSQKMMLAGLLESLLEMPQADPLVRTKMLLGFHYNLTYHDNSPEHASKVSDLLTILTDLPLDAVRAMLLLTRDIFVRGGPDSVSLMSFSLNSGHTDKSPNDVAGFPFKD